MFQVVLPVAVAFLAAFFATPLVLKIAKKIGAVDVPSDRKVHSSVMPRMGGLAIYFGFTAAIVFTQPLSMKIVGLLLGCTIIILLGLLDDIKGVSPKAKLLGQSIAALVVVFFGIRVEFLTNPFADILSLGILAIPFTVLWIVGVTNAINLIDGLDGLAAGTSGIAAVTIAIVAWMEGHAAVAMLSLVLAGAVFGFLPFNFNPARIFMGDTGSMFLGYSLSVLAVIGLTKSATIISIFIPIIILGLPIFDTAFAIIRRIVNGSPIFQADKEHLHHQLLDIGMTHKQVVLIMYGVSLCLGSSAILMSILAPDQAVIILVSLAVLVLIGINHLSIGSVAKRRQKVKDFSG
ncbi:MAG: MraY family glycosyltransferase [Bacillota bacterium]